MSEEKKLTIRNDANDFLVFTQENGGDGIDVLATDGSVWLTQKMICQLYDSSKSNISEHLKAIFEGGELDENSVVRNFRTTATDGKAYDQKYYNLQAIIAVGFKVNSQKATRFRAWASDILANFSIKGYVIDKERLKNNGIFTRAYFDNLLEDIREIRLSERMFYQKITDIYATAFDYDPKSPKTQKFFKTVQNRLHSAVHGHTAAEVIKERANAEREHMGLETWEQAPHGKIRKSDVTVAKNYLELKEQKSLARLVTAYLEFAEFQAERRIPMSMDNWEERLNLFIQASGSPLRLDAGTVSALEAKIHAEGEFDKYRVVQDKKFRSDFDKFVEEADEAVESVNG